MSFYVGCVFRICSVRKVRYGTCISYSAVLKNICICLYIYLDINTLLSLRETLKNNYWLREEGFVGLLKEGDLIFILNFVVVWSF